MNAFGNTRLDKTRQHKTIQQYRTTQDTTIATQDNARQDKTIIKYEHGITLKDNTISDKRKHDKTIQYQARKGKTHKRQDNTPITAYAKTKQDKTRHSKTSQDKTRQGNTMTRQDNTIRDNHKHNITRHDRATHHKWTHENIAQYNT